MSDLRVSEVQFTSARCRDRESGILGWISFVLDEGLRIDGLALRRTVEGRRRLTFPARRDGRGRLHFYVQPLDPDARRAVERQIFRALGLEDDAEAW